MRLLLRLAGAEVWRRPAHSAILAVAVALGTALVTAIQAVNGAASGSLRETFALLAGEAQLQVRARAGGVPEELAAQLKREPGVARATALVAGTLWVTDGPARGETLAIFGVDLGDGDAAATYRLGDHGASPIEDPVVFLSRPDSVLLSGPLMARFGLSVGDTLPVLAPTGALTLTVRGTLAAEGMGRLFAGNLAVMDLFAAERALARDRVVDHVDVVVDAHHDVDAVRAHLRSVLAPTLEVVTPGQRGAATERVLGSFEAVLSGISLLGLLFGAFVSYNVAATAIATRLRELGTLRCVGAGRRQMRALVLVETALPALGGSVVGIVAGAALARVLCGPLAYGLGYAVRVALPVGGTRVPPLAIPLALATGLGAALLGAWGPARAAALLAPRHAGRAAPALHAGRVAGAGLVAVALAGATLAAGVARESAGLANGAILCLNAAIVLLALAALPGAGRRMQGILARGGAYGRVAGDTLVRAPLRASVTTTVIAMALAVTLTIGSVVTSFKGSLVTYLRHLWAADLVVSSPSNAEAWLPAPLADTVADEIATVPGVAASATARYVSLEQDGERIALRAIQRSYLEDPRFGGFLFHAGEPAAALATVAAGRAVLVSDNLARRHGLRVGDPYTLTAPDGVLTLPVAGIVTDFLSETGTVTLARETYAAVWHDRLVTYVELLAAPGVTADELRHAIAARFAGRFPLRVLTPAELRGDFERDLDAVFSFLWALRLAVVVIAALGIADTLLGLGVARARELGVLRALGARRRGVYGLFGVEGLVPGALGIVFGVAGALALSAAWVRFLTYQLGWHIDLYVPLGEYVVLAAATAVLCAAAATVPIAWLARRTPAVLLAHE